MRFDDYKKDVQKFCLRNNLDFGKILKLPKSGNSNFIMVAHSDGHTDGSQGLLDDTPMPCVLIINKERDGSIGFEKTKYTAKYLSL
jgi:hypothetical protein